MLASLMKYFTACALLFSFTLQVKAADALDLEVRRLYKLEHKEGVPVGRRLRLSRERERLVNKNIELVDQVYRGLEDLGLSKLFNMDDLYEEGGVLNGITTPEKMHQEIYRFFQKTDLLEELSKILRKSDMWGDRDLELAFFAQQNGLSCLFFLNAIVRGRAIPSALIRFFDGKKRIESYGTMANAESCAIETKLTNNDKMDYQMFSSPGASAISRFFVKAREKGKLSREQESPFDYYYADEARTGRIRASYGGGTPTELLMKVISVKRMQNSDSSSDSEYDSDSD